MRNPDKVLDILSSKAKTPDYAFERLYRNLYNVEFYLDAYRKIYAKEGNMTPGTDHKTIDGMSVERIEKLIESMKKETYQPVPSKRVYIPKKNGKKRPLGIPSVEDKLTQEVVRSMLEAIYEPIFSERSHGFRPNRSCHTALAQCKSRFNGVRWFIEGDIRGFFDHIDHHILIKMLRKRIKDERLLNLIWKFLRAGYLEDWTFHRTHSGTPQGGIISPLLANIYLHELDQYMEEYVNDFHQGRERPVNRNYQNVKHRQMRLRKKHQKMWPQLDEKGRQQAKQDVKELEKKLRREPYYDYMNPQFKRVQYVRYADDFLIGVIGSKEDARMIKRDITIFLERKLGLELSQEKTLITHSNTKARFLGYDVVVSRSSHMKRRSDGYLTRSNSNKCHLYLPRDVWINKLLRLDAITMNGNKWKPKQRTYLKNYDDLEIFSIYNAEISGLYNYYQLANNVSVLSSFRSFMKYSMLKTLANKYRSSVAKMYKKLSIDGDLAVQYQTSKGPRIRYFHQTRLTKATGKTSTSATVDNMPNTLAYRTRSSLIERLLANKCEWCHAEHEPIQMHHVRKLKDLKGKKRWEHFMIARQRKTLALCRQCHIDLHGGRLD